MMALQDTLGAERFAVKLTYASDVLRTVTESAKNLELAERRVLRYVRQTNLLLTWRKGNAAMQVVGSTAKAVGAVAVIASSINPRLQLAVRAGERLWKLGAGLKILSSIAEILKELWQKGCRNCLLEFTKQTAQLVKNLGVFNELVIDLRQTLQDTDTSNTLDTPEQVWNAVSSFIPHSQAQRVYVPHIICIVMGCQSYSPLFDFAASITDPSNNSNISRLMREIESFKFLEFVQESDSKELIAIGSFLHVTRELLDFLDGLRRLSDSDCVFLQQCLTRFSEECGKIKTVVTFLKGLKDMRAAVDSVKRIDCTHRDSVSLGMETNVQSETNDDSANSVSQPPTVQASSFDREQEDAVMLDAVSGVEGIDTSHDVNTHILQCVENVENSVCT